MDAGRKVVRGRQPKGDVNFWLRLRAPTWSHVGLQQRGQERLKSMKTAIFVRCVKACEKKADSETILAGYARRAERQKRAKVMECLLEMNFQPLQDSIEFGIVLGWISWALGLHVGRFLGPNAFQERHGKQDKKETKTRSEKKIPKSTKQVLGTPPLYPLPDPPLSSG